MFELFKLPKPKYGKSCKDWPHVSYPPSNWKEKLVIWIYWLYWNHKDRGYYLKQCNTCISWYIMSWYNKTYGYMCEDCRKKLRLGEL